VGAAWEKIQKDQHHQDLKDGRRIKGLRVARPIGDAANLVGPAYNYFSALLQEQV
jgi:hypothetical protein